ncbi:MAG: 50S ribosomal protein L18 [Candidatus Neomarinimicrobiota bacterium]|nr:50S ribosomal protein L18 [Candidatus Neomarinimicrobiota bacterium]
MSQFTKQLKRNQRRRNRSKRTSMFHVSYPRLVVYRSNNHIQAQIINDFEGKTLVSGSSRDKDLSDKISKKATKTDVSRLVGENLAKKAKKKKIIQVVFDRNGYPYHGRIKAFADGVRKGGLKI